MNIQNDYIRIIIYICFIPTKMYLCLYFNLCRCIFSYICTGSFMSSSILLIFLLSLGSVVVADNVLSFNQPLDSYLQHVRDTSDKGNNLIIRCIFISSLIQ